jgi:hypothetical protein
MCAYSIYTVKVKGMLFESEAKSFRSPKKWFDISPMRVTFKAEWTVESHTSGRLKESILNHQFFGGFFALLGNSTLKKKLRLHGYDKTFL